MQLAHLLLPHLDAEIDRLQKARDLLAFVPDFIDFSAGPRGSRAPFTTAIKEQAPSSLVQDPGLLFTHQADPEHSAAPEVVTAAVSNPAPRIVRGRGPRALRGRSEFRQDKRKRLVVLDTALRGSVPAGPVVVSAEDVRKSQASKTAQAERAAEVKKAGIDPLASFTWRSETSNVRSMDAILQRLIHLGDEDGADAKLNRFVPLDQREGLS